MSSCRRLNPPYLGRSLLRDFILKLFPFALAAACNTASAQIPPPATSPPFEIDVRMRGDSMNSVSPTFELDARHQSYELSLAEVPGVLQLDTSGDISISSPVSGLVHSTAGAPLAGVSVSVVRLGKAFWEGATDLNGRFTIPPLVAQNYQIYLSKSGFVRSISTLANASTGTQSLVLVLRSMPPPAQEIASDRRPTTEEVGILPTDGWTGPDKPESQLRIFNRATKDFMAVSNAPGSRLNPNDDTIILTHGWNSKPGDWPLEMANALAASDSSANVAAWDWELEAKTNAPDPYKAMTQGRLLGIALRRRLSPSAYQGRFHFIGHSMGTLVNRYACDDAHQIGPSANPEIEAFDHLRTRPHLTLLDEAELTSLLGISMPQTGSTLAVIADWVQSIFNGVKSYATNSSPWRSPIPETPAVWIDNYISMVGLQKDEAVNVALIHPAREHLNPVEAHGYAYKWYIKSVQANSPSVGWKKSWEAGSTLPPAGSGFEPGSLWYDTKNDQFELKQRVDPIKGEATLDIVDRYYNYYISPTGLGIVSTRWLAEQAETLTVTGANFIVQGGEKIGQGLDAGFDAAQDFLGNLKPDQWLPSLSRPDYKFFLGKANSETFTRTKSSEDVSNSDASIWMTLQVPPDAAAMQFDFTVIGEARGRLISAAINGHNIMIIPAELMPRDQIQSSDLIDISQYAGKSIEVFFGYTGDSLAPSQLIIEGLRYVAVPTPSLSLDRVGDEIALKWPAAATGWQLEGSPDLAFPQWFPIKLPESNPIEDGGIKVMISPTADKMFYRLRKSN